MENAPEEQFKGEPIKKGPPKQQVGESALAAAPARASRPAKPEFVKIEKSLASLGFFTPSNKRIPTQKSKVVTSLKMVSGSRGRVTIVPGAMFGLPNTADQDKYFALVKIINDAQRTQGKIENPIRFSSAQILAL